MGFLWLILLVTSAVSVLAEHVPADWNDMELCKWYDLADYGPEIYDFQCDPNHPGRMYGRVGEWLRVHYITRSDDYGRSWSKSESAIDTPVGSVNEITNFHVWFGPDRQTVFWLVGTIPFDPDDPLDFQIYLLTRSDENAPWEIVSNLSESLNFSSLSAVRNLVATETGRLILQRKGTIWVSDDHGATWRKTFEGKGSNNDCIALSPHSNDTVYISSNYNTESLLWKSTDKAETWTPLNITYNTPGIGGEGLARISCHPTDPQCLYVFVSFVFNGSYNYGVKKTVDGGNTWTDFGPESGDHPTICSTIYLSPSSPGLVILGASSSPSIYVSHDGGQTWEVTLSLEVSNIPYADILVESPWNPGILYFSTYGVYESVDSGANWNRTCPIFNYPYETHKMGHVDPENPKKMILLEEFSGAFWSEDGGQHWNPGTGFSMCEPGIDFPIAVDATDRNTLYSNVWDFLEDKRSMRKTVNFGRHWDRLYGPESYEVDYVTCSSTVHDKVFLIATPLENENINRVFESTDAGASWTELGLPENHVYYDIKDSPHDANLVLVLGIDRDAMREYLYRSTDKGVTFIRIGPENGYDTTVDYVGRCSTGGLIYFHPCNNMIAYAGYHGSSISYDAGVTWENYEDFRACKGCFEVNSFDPAIIKSYNRITRDNGLTWSTMRVGFGRFPLFAESDLMISAAAMSIIRMDAMGPKIQLAGFGTSLLQTSIPSDLSFIAYVVDPSENDIVDHLELYVDGAPAGFTIDAQTDHKSPNWALIEWTLPITPGDPFRGLMEFRAMDSFGNVGMPWPLVQQSE